MFSKTIAVMLAVMTLSGCASMKGPRETNALNLDGSHKTSEEMRQYDLRKSREPDDVSEKLRKQDLALAYAAAYLQSKDKITGMAKSGPSLMAVAGFGNMGVAVLDRASSLLGGTSLFSGAFAGGMFIGGFLGGINDSAVSYSAKQRYAIFMSPTTLNLVQISPSDSSLGAQLRHADIERAFIQSTKVASAIGCEYSFDGSLFSQAILGASHIRYFKCSTVGGNVSIDSAVSDWVQPNSVMSSVTLLHGTTPATDLYGKLKDKIPAGYVAIFIGKVQGQTKVLAVMNDVVAAFDPPAAP